MSLKKIVLVSSLLLGILAVSGCSNQNATATQLTPPAPTQKAVDESKDHPHDEGDVHE